LNRKIQTLVHDDLATAERILPPRLPANSTPTALTCLHPTTSESQSWEESPVKVIAIGASTGGTEAILQIVARFPASTPGVVIVLHMPSGFTKLFAQRLNQICVMSAKEAETGDRIMPGRILVAPGDFHLMVYRLGAEFRVSCSQGEKVCGHRPSVEVLFNSVAKNVRSNAIGVMLTGMGHDGADGMVAMRKAGARTIAQDEATSVVFGMPKVAFERGGVERLAPIHHIAQIVMGMLMERPR
jgi:two-component system chemotaxis response regulator CheB